MDRRRNGDLAGFRVDQAALADPELEPAGGVTGQNVPKKDYQ